MTLTYIFHSGFALETAKRILVFDYWMDPARVIPGILQSEKPMYVFSSHFHEDHFTREILEWRKHKPNITYILSKDIQKRKRAAKNEADVWLAKGSSWSDDMLEVTATGSNDSGVSWIVETGGRRIFHAGDLNNWYARFLHDETLGTAIHGEDGAENVNPVYEEKRYLGELKDIRKLTDRFDLVMFPVDGRIGNGYTLGGRQFLEYFQVGMFVPMHFVASGFESAWRFRDFADERQAGFWPISHEGEQLEVFP